MLKIRNYRIIKEHHKHIRQKINYFLSPSSLIVSISNIFDFSSKFAVFFSEGNNVQQKKYPKFIASMDTNPMIDTSVIEIFHSTIPAGSLSLTAYVSHHWKFFQCLPLFTPRGDKCYSEIVK